MKSKTVGLIVAGVLGFLALNAVSRATTGDSIVTNIGENVGESVGEAIYSAPKAYISFWEQKGYDAAQWIRELGNKEAFFY